MKTIMAILFLIGVIYGGYIVIKNIYHALKKYIIKRNQYIKHKKEMKIDFYKRLNENEQYNRRKDFGLSEEKNWQHYWNNNKPYDYDKSTNVLFRIIQMLCSLLSKILKIIFVIVIIIIVAVTLIIITSIIKNQ